MGMIEEVGTYLDAQSTRWTLGTNLYLNWLPDEPNRAAAIYETAGAEPARSFQSVAWETPRIQVICRSTSFPQARDDADTMWSILEGVVNQTLSGKDYLRISAVQSPFLIERDERGRPYFGANFDVARRR